MDLPFGTRGQPGLDNGTNTLSGRNRMVEGKKKGIHVKFPMQPTHFESFAPRCKNGKLQWYNIQPALEFSAFVTSALE